MIKLINVNKVIDGVTVLSDVNLEINEKDKVGIVGLHGSSKTILMEILAGEIKPSNGKVILPDKRKIAYIPQVPKFPTNLKVKEILRYVYNDKLPLEIDLNKLAKELTLEEKKKLYYLLHLPFSPNYLLIDEFSPSLGEIVKKFKGGIVISHYNLRDIWEFINKVIILSKGKIVFKGNKEDLLYKIIVYKDKEVWVKEGETFEKENIVEVKEVSPDEVFLHFYARA